VDAGERAGERQQRNPRGGQGEVNRAGHAEDIVTVERLGLLEQSIVTREGTDPPGLLASIGGYLPAELLCVVP
jgi:hypothetical protein